MTDSINGLIMRLTRRAEMSDPSDLVETFVSAGSMFDLMQSVDHQVLYGRRGTGKTHALTYLSETTRASGDLSILVDMRSIGSAGSLYSDPSANLAERATRLCLDVLGHIHDQLTTLALAAVDDGILSGSSLPLLDRLADELARVRVTGTVEVEGTHRDEVTSARTAGVGGALGSRNSGLSLSTSSTEQHEEEASRRVMEVGVQNPYLHTGAIMQRLNAFMDSNDGRRLWILLDEWSSVPIDLQPLLADLVKRCFFPVGGVTVKIAAIEHRTKFKDQVGTSEYLGIEVGADIAADLDLDDYMVFDNDGERARDFFSALIHRHLRSLSHESGDTGVVPHTADGFVRAAFTQKTAFEELVRAAEGVPRDALNILILAAQRAVDQSISVPVVRSAAKAWYQRDKEAAATASADAKRLLVWITAEVIGGRKARAFMLKQGADSSHPLIRSLYDNRVLHIIKRGVSSRDDPGSRYNVFAIDYGCYVDLVSTTQAPKGLFEVSDSSHESAEYVQVPVDDYRSIRRAILNLSDFEKATPKGLSDDD